MTAEPHAQAIEFDPRQTRLLYRDLSKHRGRCDRAAAERAVKTLYRMTGCESPEFVWCDSPLKMCRLLVMWDLMEWINSPGRSRMRITFRQMLLEELLQPHCRDVLNGPIDAGAFWRITNVENTDEIADSWNRLLSWGIIKKLHDEFREPYDPQTWLTAAREFMPVLDDLDDDLTLNWRDFIKLFAAHEHDEQTRVLSIIHDAASNVTWLPAGSALGLDSTRAFDVCWGNGDAELLCAVHLWIERDNVALDALREALRHCGWWRPERRICFMADRPEIVDTDGTGRLHGLLRYADGYELCALHNTEVHKRIVEGKFGVHDIEQTDNIEVRRSMIERYGTERYLLDSGAELVDEDECGHLFRKKQFNDEPLVMVRVKNSTPEPDGKYKFYFLRVPPDICSARKAVAWTFGMNGDEYAPSIET